MRGGVEVAQQRDDGGVVGGDDYVDGGDGNDVILGDSGGFGDLQGGDDVLYGGAGDDLILGQDGNDFLCGEDGDDLLIGGSGVDLACAVDDEDTAVEGVETTFDAAANDEFLDDEDEEDGPLVYVLVGTTGGIVGALVDELTGEITYTATEDGSITYEVRRYISEVEFLSSFATLDVTVLPIVEPEDPDESDDPEVEASAVTPGAAVLPDTGMSSGALGALLGAMVSLLAGGALVARGRRSA